MNANELTRELEQNAARYPGSHDLNEMPRPATADADMVGLLESLNARWEMLTAELHRCENWADLTGRRPEDHPQYGMVASYLVECDRMRNVVCDLLARQRGTMI